MSEIYLGVNIDHVATVREARKSVNYPDPLHAAIAAEAGGADGITIHLREDRRHIQDRDLLLVQELLQTRLNMEMAITEEMLLLAGKVKPVYACLVPEKREEITTEGGLEVAGDFERVQSATKRLQDMGIQVSLFIDADKKQIDAARETGAELIEIHTGRYAELSNLKQTPENKIKLASELFNIKNLAHYANSIGLIVNAGHGLHYHNVAAIAAIPEFYELNIGHAIIARAIFVGMESAVREMKVLMLNSRNRK